MIRTMKLEVYRITNKRNGKIYIGITSQGVDVRWCKHCSDARHNSEFPIHNAIRKHGEESFQVELIEEVEDVEVLKEREIYWIKEYSSYDRKKGYNLTTGGDGTFGRFHSEETKDKIRQKHLGKKQTEGTKEKFRNRKGVNKEVFQYTLDMIYVNSFKSVAEAGRFTSGNRHVISAVARGIRKQAYGFIWKYKIV